jgi:GT2 family glycosyltransferase
MEKIGIKDETRFGAILADDNPLPMNIRYSIYDYFTKCGLYEWYVTFLREYMNKLSESNKEKFSYLVGWCLAFKKEVIDSIGYIPENFGMGFFDDVLFCYRAKKAGFKMGIVENTGVIHKYHQTFKAEGYNLAEEYKNKREIFLDILENEKR